MIKIATNDLSKHYKRELDYRIEKHGFDVVFETANNIGILDDTNFHILRIDLNKYDTLQGVYFYNGFNKPEKLADNLNDFITDLKNKETGLTDNYKGDISKDIENELTEILEDTSASEQDINDTLYSYSLFYKPTVKVFQDININRYGLRKNEYLTDFIAERGTA